MGGEIRLRKRGEVESLTCNTDGKPILNLPERTLELVSCTFDAEEQAFYDALAQKSELTFNKVSWHACGVEFLGVGGYRQSLMTDDCVLELELILGPVLASGYGDAQLDKHSDHVAAITSR